MAVAAAALGGCGSSDDKSAGALTWVDRPREVVAAPGFPDRIVQGRIRNGSLERVEIRSEDVRAIDADGKRVDASIVFNDAFTKPLFPQDRDMTLPDFDRRRIGLIVTLKPGQDAPLTVGFRQRSGGAGRPVRIDYGDGTLAIGATEMVTSDSSRRNPRGPITDQPTE